MRWPGTGTTPGSIVPSPQSTLTLPHVPVPLSVNLISLSTPPDSPGARLTLRSRLICGLLVCGLQPASTRMLTIPRTKADVFTFYLPDGQITASRHVADCEKNTR